MKPEEAIIKTPEEAIDTSGNGMTELEKEKALEKTLNLISEILRNFSRGLNELAPEELREQMANITVDEAKDINDGWAPAKELQQYREIGTVEECREAVERNRAKEPVIRKEKYSDGYYCPICDHVFIHKDETGWFCGQHFKNCPVCGQVILWDLEKIKENTGDNAEQREYG